MRVLRAALQAGESTHAVLWCLPGAIHGSRGIHADLAPRRVPAMSAPDKAAAAIAKVDADRARRVGEILASQAAGAGEKPTLGEQLEDLQLDGAAILDETRDFIRLFCMFPNPESLNAVALWAAHAHLAEHLHTTPRLALLSPEPASGKTRVLEVLETLVPEPMLSISASPAAVFRTLASRLVTLLIDEVDAIFRQAGKDDHNEDLRALLNAGYRRGATIPRCVGPQHDVRQFAVFCPVALAGLGDLPETLMSRSVVVRMRRRAPGEDVEPFRSRQHEPAGHAVRRKLEAWASVVGPSVAAAWPDMPPGIVDRPAEVWEPLVAVADAAGWDWPDRARAACVVLNAAAQDRRVSLGIRLLADLKSVFGDATAMHTETILERLCNGEQYGLEPDAPWGELHGKPLGVRGLAGMLKRYGVHSTKVTVTGRSLQGYRREHLWDAWQRYLPSSPAGVELPELATNGAQIAKSTIPPIPQVPDARTTRSAP